MKFYAAIEMNWRVIFLMFALFSCVYITGALCRRSDAFHAWLSVSPFIYSYPFLKSVPFSPCWNTRSLIDLEYIQYPTWIYHAPSDASKFPHFIRIIQNPPDGVVLIISFFYCMDWLWHRHRLFFIHLFFISHGCVNGLPTLSVMDPPLFSIFHSEGASVEL